MTLWAGRFADAQPSEALIAFSSSLAADLRLAQDDIEGSRAHVRGLERSGLIEATDAWAILAALDTVSDELRGDEFAFGPEDEDIHTAIERRVTELAGTAGARLHTGRSRNDQVALALRLWCKRELGNVAAATLRFEETLAARAEEVGDAYLPGYTHLQRAQPVGLAHHLLAHGWALARDVERLVQARARLDISPLGAGALAGSSLALDPEAVAEDLGMARAFENSLDAVSDRDFVAEALFDLALLGVHLSRLGEEIVLWSSAEFGFVVLDDSWSTGSSMMPQKKNPDIAELARGGAGRLIGHLTGVLATLKGLPLAYNRDLQETKPPLFDAVDQITVALAAMDGLVDSAQFDIGRMAEAAGDPALAATDLAEYLVAKGMPFRDAHGVVADLVRRSMGGEASLATLVSSTPAFGPDAEQLLTPGVAVGRRTTRGGGGPAVVADQLVRYHQELDRQRSLLTGS